MPRIQEAAPEQKIKEKKDQPPTTPQTESNGASSPEGKKSRSRKKKPEPVVERPVLYEALVVRKLIGESAMSAADCKKLLGWTTESENIKFGGDYLLTDHESNKVRCYNNVTNRPLYRSVVDTLAQEHLRRKWRMNGEPIIIGKTGLVLNGQHQMTALILASQIWQEKQGQYQHLWPTEPTMEKIVVFGIEETDAVVNTMDTCKPRSLADVIYRSTYFASMKIKDRRMVSRITDNAVKMLWHRTGAGLDAFAPRRTHAEALDFINRHPRLLECVKHIYEEDGDEQRIRRYISPGYAAAFMYLMATSATNREQEGGYSLVDTPSEAQLSWNHWDKAQDFWVLLAAQEASMDAIREVLGNHIEQGTGTVAVRCALLAKAWNAHLERSAITEEDLELEWETDRDTGEKKLAECPTVEGIDLGDPK